MQHIISYYNELNDEQFLTNLRNLREIHRSSSTNKAGKEEVVREIVTTRKLSLTARGKT